VALDFSHSILNSVFRGEFYSEFEYNMKLLFRPSSPMLGQYIFAPYAAGLNKRRQVLAEEG
jgi:hypothetical protein